jgi:hypothetical protein
MGAWVMPALTIASGLMGMSSARKARRLAKSQSDTALEYQKEQDAKLEAQKDIYKSMVFTNPYEKMTNSYKGMENTMEDMQVNTQSADYATQTFRQQQADTLSGLRGAAGSSGVAGLAQSMANMGLKQSQEISAMLGQQEQGINMATAQESSRIQQMVMGEDARVQMAQLGGEVAKEQAERDRQSTLLGMQAGMAAGANKNVQQGYANQMAAANANTSAAYGVASSLISSGGGEDGWINNLIS